MGDSVGFQPVTRTDRYGGSFSPVPGAGAHTITAKVTGIGDLSGSSPVTISVANSQIALGVRAYRVKSIKFAINCASRAQ